jgi:ketosteroid isomerase-like protein
MNSIINRLGFIAVIVTSTLAFEVCAHENTSLDTEIREQNLTNSIGQADKLQIDAVLDGLHKSASVADWHNYFDSYHKDAVFLGTDGSERWGMEEFKQYAKASQGWHYEVKQRKLLQINDIIVFDEALHSPSYGKCRGTGALVQTKDGWKVAQYHLTFPIPNDKAKEITQVLSKP